MDKFKQALENNPIIAAIKSRQAFETALSSPVETLFLLEGNICELREITQQAQAAQKQVYLHIDLMEGIGRDAYAIRFLSEHVKPDGIITTKAGLVKPAREHNLYVIQRIFMLDSMSLDTGLRALERNGASPNAIEILPGILPSIIATFSGKTEKPIIAGGLIRTKEDVISGLKAGAMGISTSKQELWAM